MTGELTAEIARTLLRYEPETGRLFWRKRDAKWFVSGARSAEHKCNNWNSIFAGKEAFTAKTEGYRNGRIFNRKYHAHRIIWLIAHGHFPEHHIDHQNGNRSDNRIANLREVTRQENQKNLRLPSHNKSGICGVCWNAQRGKWLASITVNRKNKFIGHFTDKEEATAARKRAEEEYGYHQNHGRV